MKLISYVFKKYKQILDSSRKRKDWNKILNEGENITNDKIQEQKIVRDCDEQLYTKKSDKLADKDKFLFLNIQKFLKYLLL